MTNNIVINYRKHAIEISKTFSKKASIYNSEEYNALKGAKADFPTFRVEVKSAPKRKIEDRITMEDIINYVRENSGDTSKEMETLKELRGKSVKEAGSLLKAEETATFSDIKEWFFATYPAISAKTEKRQARIAKIVADAKKTNEKTEEVANETACV